MRATLVGLLVLLVAGCGGSGISSGLVTAKDDRPAYSSTEILPVYAGESCRKTGSATYCSPHYNYLPFVVYHPERFTLELRACPADGGKCRTGRVSIGKTEWETVKVGDEWSKHGAAPLSNVLSTGTTTSG